MARSSSRQTTCCWSTASGPPRTPSRCCVRARPNMHHTRVTSLAARSVLTLPPLPIRHTLCLTTHHTPCPQVGSSLSGSKVTTISHGVSGVINPVTVSGMIVAAGATGRPVVSSAYPEWIAQYMLEENNGYYTRYPSRCPTCSRTSSPPPPRPTGTRSSSTPSLPTSSASARPKARPPDGARRADHVRPRPPLLDRPAALRAGQRQGARRTRGGGCRGRARRVAKA